MTARERLPVELSGLPVFDRERHFRGYRGFGVCRDIGRINELAFARRERPIGFMTRSESSVAGSGGAAANPAETAAAEIEQAAAPQWNQPRQNRASRPPRRSGGGRGASAAPAAEPAACGQCRAVSTGDVRTEGAKSQSSRT